MNEENSDTPKPSIPKPTIRNTPPVKPPVTNADIEEPKAPEVKKEAEPEHNSTAKGIETDLVKRFLGAFIDSIVAFAIGYIVLSITVSGILQWITIGLVFLTRDSLPILNGQSLGKKVMKTKAVKQDGSSLSGDWVTGATRNILLAIPLAGLIEVYILLTRSSNPGDGLRLGDDWAKTKVISVE